MANGVVVNEKFYAWDGTAYAKLLPNEDSGLVVERNGVAETYVCNRSLQPPFNCYCKAVKRVQRPTKRTEYIYQEGDQYYLYGFDYQDGSFGTIGNIREKVQVINGTLKFYSDDGETEFDDSYADWGTGTQARVYDLNGNIAENFRIITFGDIEGNGSITVSDRVLANALAKGTATYPEQPWKYRAADLNQDGIIDASDCDRIVNLVSYRNRMVYQPSAGKAYLSRDYGKAYTTESNLVIERNGIAEVNDISYEPLHGVIDYKYSNVTEFYDYLEEPKYYMYGIGYEDEEGNRYTVADLKAAISCTLSGATITTNKEDTDYLCTGLEIYMKDTFNKTFETFIYILFGDVNGDGEIDSDDIVLLEQFLDGTQSLTEAQFRAANISQTGQITLLDKSQITEFLNGFSTINQLTGRLE